MPRINAAGLALIESFEGLRLRAYPDPGTNGAPFTVGYGHTASVHPGDVITTAQAIAFLEKDCARAEAAVASAVHVVLTPNEFSALVSFEYNTGALGGSPLALCLNKRDFRAAMVHLMLYVYAGGEVFAGLVRRRTAERALFLGGH